MIEVHHVTKRYGSTLAVDGLSFEVRYGEVTGFLGPNGAGKSTTMRMMIGLDAPTSGRVTVDGHRYADLRFLLTLPPWAVCWCSSPAPPSPSSSAGFSSPDATPEKGRNP